MGIRFASGVPEREGGRERKWLWGFVLTTRTVVSPPGLPVSFLWKVKKHSAELTELVRAFNAQHAQNTTDEVVEVTVIKL